MEPSREPRWKKSVSKDDYDSAFNYLSILMDEARAREAVKALEKADISERRVNDILRGCHREPLPVSDPGVSKTLDKISSLQALQPVQVVSFEFGGDIADGYHRVSACYHLDPFMTIPCKLAEVHP